MRYVVAAIMACTVVALPALAAAPSSNPADVKAGIYVLDPSHGKITWSINHLGFSTYTGQFAHATATLRLDPKAVAQTTLASDIDINSLGTLNPALDKVLKSDKFFDAAKYPVAKFASTSVQQTGAKTAEITGNLTLHGITKPVSMMVTFNQSGTNPIEDFYEVGFDGRATLKRSDFDMTGYIPAVGDEVTLEIEGEFHLKS